MRARVIIFDMQVDNGVLYHGIANQPFAYSSLYLSNFLSFHTLNDEIFRQKISAKLCKLELSYFSMQVDNGVLYRGIANQPSPAYCSLYLSDFLSFHTLNDEIFVKDFCETVQVRVFIFGMQVDNDVLYRWSAN